MKRLLREFFRLNQHMLTLPIDLVVVPKRGLDVASINYWTVEAELTPALTRIIRDFRSNRPAADAS